jgi:hypothetical protein
MIHLSEMARRIIFFQTPERSGNEQLAVVSLPSPSHVVK